VEGLWSLLVWLLALRLGVRLRSPPLPATLSPRRGEVSNNRRSLGGLSELGAGRFQLLFPFATSCFCFDELLLQVKSSVTQSLYLGGEPVDFLKANQGNSFKFFGLVNLGGTPAMMSSAPPLAPSGD